MSELFQLVSTGSGPVAAIFLVWIIVDMRWVKKSVEELKQDLKKHMENS